ncbi:MAG: hypothetical protein IPO19_09655 [Rhodoferax sp.]|nr:hypothetical protein [Rhodoferax sp.]
MNFAPKSCAYTKPSTGAWAPSHANSICIATRSRACSARPAWWCAHPRARQIDLYLPFITETLSKYPSLRASRLHVMLQERGYTGSSSHFRHLLASLRPRREPEAYLRLRTLPGEQAQVDWLTLAIGALAVPSDP